MKNPILKGFHPDPSVTRLGDDFYLAVSTFEWYPGVQVFHSTDLVNWKLVARPLDRPSLLEMKGVPDSCGIWAPCMSHDGERFHLVYTVVRSFDGVWKDSHNYLTTAKNIEGPWSEAVYLGSHGFDPSLFHDEDGRKWYLSMEVDQRKGRMFGGIILQEYDPGVQKLTGPVHRIFQGTRLGNTEGPHLYRKDGYYYLLLAEGGTEYRHAATLARSRSLTGPYELSPKHPLITAAGAPGHPLQKTGHGDMVHLEGDRWALFFLTGRPLTPNGRCPLGRETAMDILDWPEGEWPSLAAGGSLPRHEIAELPSGPSGPLVEEIDFSRDALPETYQSLRVPMNESWVSHDKNKGALILGGRESLTSTFEQSLLARRIQSFDFEYEVQLRFSPENFQQLAGLHCYYNTGHYFYLHIVGNEDGHSRYVQLLRCDNFQVDELLPEAVLLPEGSDSIGLKVLWKRAMAVFSYQIDGGAWMDFPGSYDASILSDDYVRDGSSRYRPAFTGAFVGVACQDLSGGRKEAAFLSLVYRELELD